MSDPVPDPPGLAAQMAVPLDPLELAEWRGVRADRYHLVPGLTRLRLVAEIDRRRAVVPAAW